ncbi:B12-binding domain-containing radical SAM protein [Bradyrhizobium japonicum]|uniref:B12-binding domain-containing radical SAM protein n=1 Tax=Bradyrhizobium japonicum TaxID=375 RepID=UPI0018AD52A3|nr:radical SAM protein [Bradyrhizobium japonicum]
MSWALKSIGASGDAIDCNIQFARELICDKHLSELSLRVPRQSTRGVMLASLASLSENERLKFPRAFDISYPVKSNRGGRASLSEDEQRYVFGTSQTFNALVKLVAMHNPTFVGISILSHSQMLYAVEIAKWIRGRSKATIVFGGSEISGWSTDRIRRLSEEPYVDHVVLGDGEFAIRRLWQGVGCNEKIVRGEPLSLGQIPIGASFELDSDLYLKPKLLNVVESKGCYWNRCTHCDYIALNEELDVGRRVGQLVDGLEAHGKSTGIYDFHLVNETLTPSRAKKLAIEIAQRRSRIRWNSFVKIDRRFGEDILRLLPPGGCDFLVIGLESLSDQALRVLDKGYTAKEALEWIRTARRCGVNLVLNFIVGIPGTTIEDEMITLDRLAEFPELASRSKVFSFVLSRLSMMGQKPASFGIDVLKSPDSAAEAHRGGSSLRFRKSADIENRLNGFRQGLQQIMARHRLAGPLAHIILACQFDRPIPQGQIRLSSSVAATLAINGRTERCEIYDYRNGTNLSLPSHFYPDLEFLIKRRLISASEFLAGKKGIARASLLQHLGEAGFIRVEKSEGPHQARSALIS